MGEQNMFKKLNRLKAFCNLPEDASWNNYKVLKTALQCEQKDVVFFLLGAGCRVNSKSGELGNTPLHYAVRLEDTALVQTLLSKGASLTCQNHKGDTPLHVAAMSRNTEIVDLLLYNIERTQYVNPVNNFGLTHMHIACMRNKSDIVEKFLKNGVGKDITISSNSPLWPEYTPLHIAVEFCCLDVMQLLLNHDANSHYKHVGITDPCSLSRYNYQKASMINYFMCRKCCNWDDKQINFLVACLEGDERIVENYLKHGANVAEYEAYFYSLFIFKNDTPLHCAARSESVDTVRLLLKNNANINSINDYGMTPLHAAFYQAEASEQTDIGIVDLLCSTYNFKDNENLTDDNGLSFFHIICSQGDNELIKYFLEKGVDINSRVDVNAKYFAGYTPLHFAVYYCEPKTVKLLLRCGADITISAVRYFETPFELAMTQQYESIIYYIIESGIDLSAMKNSKTGQSPVHFILGDNSDWRDIIQMLYEKGCNFNSQDNNGNSPLHFSVSYAQNPLNIQAVLDLGADINIENINGETPLMSLRNRELSLVSFNRRIVYYEVYDVLLSHIQKLKAIGFYVSEKNRLFVEQLFEQQEQIDPYKRCLNPEYYSLLQQKFTIEIHGLKDIKVTNYSSLYDILFADANQMAVHCNNPILKVLTQECNKCKCVMVSKIFYKAFSSYGYLVKLQLKKGNERKAILGPAKDALKFILKKELPDVCSEKVFSYLSDNDLKTIIKINNTTDAQQTAKILSSNESDLKAKGPSDTHVKSGLDSDVEMMSD